jgi:hypothetical protein
MFRVIVATSYRGNIHTDFTGKVEAEEYCALMNEIADDEDDNDIDAVDCAYIEVI